MINLLLFLLALTCFGLIAAWIAENPGDVSMWWFGWRIDTSIAFMLFTLILAALVIAYIYIFIRSITKAPGEWSTKRQLTHHQKGLAELTYSVAALAASDVRGAEAHTRKAEKLLGKTPITLLLSTQIARSNGDDATTRQLLEQLLDHEETEYLAARSLSDSASKQKLFPRALDLAKRAHDINPKDSSAVVAMVNLHIKLGQWQEALRAIDRDARKGHMRRADMLRLRGLVHMAHGEKLLADGRAENALQHAKIAIKYLPGFAPATLFSARTFVSAGQVDKAIRILFAAWKRFKHSQVADMLKSLAKSEPKKRAKLLQTLAAEPGDTAILWTCRACGHGQPEWSLNCPTCEAFDTMR